MKHRRKRLAGISVISVMFSSLAGAAEQAQPGSQKFDFHHADVLGTALDLSVIATSSADAATAEKNVLAEVERLRKILSSYDPDAELARVNASPVGGPGIAVSKELIEVLKQYDTWSKRSRGAYSGHMGELIAIWQEAEKNKQLPTDAVLLPAAKRAGEPAWAIDEKTQTVRRIADQQINVDSLGKGFIVGKAVEAATRNAGGVKGVLLNIGGDLRVWGTPLIKGSEWAVGVQDPTKPELNATPLTTVYVPGDRAVASSGGYQRFYTIGNTHYSHIIDARTGKSARNSAATVVAPDSATANALATICCLLRPAEAMELVRSVPDAECLIITAAGDQMRTDGFRELEQSRDAASAPKLPSQFPAGFKMAIDLTTTPTQRKPYVFAWITDAGGKHVKTIGAWGNEQRWMRELREWWKIAGSDRALQTISHATQRAGSYPLSWDGTDQKGNGVPLGKYTIWIEVAAEHGPHSVKSGSITLDRQPASITIAATDAFNEVKVQYGPAGK